MTYSITDTQHKTLCIECIYAKCCYSECRYAECRYAESCYAQHRYAECHDLFIIMLNVIMLNVIMLNVLMLNVIKLNVVQLNAVAAFKLRSKGRLLALAQMFYDDRSDRLCVQYSFLPDVMNRDHKSLILQSPGVNVIKLFMAVIY